MNRPKEKDYFDYYFKRKVLDAGNCESYISALEEYIDYLALKQSENVVLDDVMNGFYNWHKGKGYITLKRDDFEEYLNSLKK